MFYKIWSDGGLKSYNVLIAFQSLKVVYDCNIECHYFAPHHGHNMCDGHFGVGKKKLRLAFASNNTMITNPQQVLSCFERIPNTVVVMLQISQSIMRVKTPTYQRRNGIRQWFQINFFRGCSVMSVFGKSDDIATWKRNVELKIISCH